MVVRQTNVLALNATIEAARAGESGTDVAVIAMSEMSETARDLLNHNRSICPVRAQRPGPAV